MTQYALPGLETTAGEDSDQLDIFQILAAATPCVLCGTAVHAVPADPDSGDTGMVYVDTDGSAECPNGYNATGHLTR